MAERLDFDAIRALYCQYRGLDHRMRGVLDGDLLADNVEALIAEVERLRAALNRIRGFADEHAEDAGRRYDANLTDLASCISALRIIASMAAAAMPPVEGVPAQEGSE